MLDPSLVPYLIIIPTYIHYIKTTTKILNITKMAKHKKDLGKK
jgi:hypothetical protein